MFWSYEDVDRLHIELTNVCNAACPTCVRFYRNSPLLRPDLTLGQITLEKFKNYFPAEIIKKCKIIFFCGVHGDPVSARDLYEICQYIAATSDCTSIGINTNGGIRSSDWWKKIGLLFASQTSLNWYITFSVDGLEDTNHLYRRNVVWKDLIRNIESFIGAGGVAKWDYLIFKHNEHQVQEALELSKKMGFREFIPKKAMGVDNGHSLISLPVLNEKGSVDYWIEAPVQPENRSLENPSAEEYRPTASFNPQQYQRLKKNKKIEDANYFERSANFYRDRFKHVEEGERKSEEASCQIRCKSQVGSSKEIFIDNFGRVFPCCYVGLQLNSIFDEEATLQLHHHMEEYGWDKFDLNKYSLETILKEGHLDRLYADTWSLPSTLDGRLKHCADTCGKASGIDKIFTHQLSTKRPQEGTDSLSSPEVQNKTE
ncbi:radical SAM protein [Pseudobdellovibrio exovorus]|uniref:Radical SAM core domain-containing protein n=1 Tax=Pseudobdellovibrio exovorus JSS TaxID=1184267 RepID=M4VAZ7_9BACT|nr:radical SAM protein [Pseudobdellovibrio exovorus]AGH96552.1 hypothetical protein A11Q_2336 [Pseudobdellovibrio exovorus JSS]